MRLDRVGVFVTVLGFAHSAAVADSAWKSWANHKPTVTAAPSKPKPAPCMVKDIQSNIDGLQADIVADNNYVNTATNIAPSVVSLQACEAQQSTSVGAANEPVRLAALTPCATQPAAVSAAAQIAAIITQIPGNLSVIQANPSNPDIVACAIDAIDYVRCNFVLPDVQVIFNNLGQVFAGLTNTVVSGPTACPQPSEGSYASPTQYNLASCGPTLTYSPTSCS